MPFRFSLQSILDFRQALEHQQELRLRLVNQELARVRHFLAQIDSGLRQLQRSRSGCLADGTTAAELQTLLDSETSLCVRRQTAERELSRLIKLRDAQLETFQDARRERELVESLRNQQLREYNRAMTRKQQRGLDDLFLLRRDFLRRG